MSRSACGLKASAPVSLQVLNVRLLGRHRLDLHRAVPPAHLAPPLSQGVSGGGRSARFHREFSKQEAASIRRSLLHDASCRLWRRRWRGRFDTGASNERHAGPDASGHDDTLDRRDPDRGIELDDPAPFGGATTGASLGDKLAHLTVLDRYGRDYAFDGGSLVRTRGSGLAVGSMTRPLDTVQMPDPSGPRLAFGPWGGSSGRPSQPASMALALTSDQTLTASVNAPLDRSNGITGSALRTLGIATSGASVGWQGPRFGVSAGSARSPDGRSELDTMTLAVRGWTLSLATLAERGQALGLAGSGAFDISRARTTMVTVARAMRLAGWALSGRMTLAQTRVSSAESQLAFDGPIRSSAFSIDTGRPMFGGWGTISASSPLRVDRARALLTLPQGYDLASQSLVMGTQRLDLTSTAREYDAELGWSVAVARRATVRLGYAHAFDAGNVPGRQDDASFINLTIRP